MSLAIVVAVAENGVIGRAGGLPWSLPDDLRHFKRLTIGHTLIMGRRTFESIGRPLPDRRTIVLSRNPAYRPAGVAVAPTLAAALATGDRDQDRFVVGGASVYAEALPLADRVYLTRVHAAPAGDTRFPSLDRRAWSLVDAIPHPADARHAFAFTIETFARAATDRKSTENARKTIA